MKPSCAKSVVQGLKQAGVNLAAVVPDSWLYEVYKLLGEDDNFRVVPVTNEGEGVALCAGAWLGGKKAVMLMENSGLRVACEALGRLQGMPVMLFMSYRGDLGDGNWWAVGMGKTTKPILEALGIPYAVVDKEEGIVKAVERAYKTLAASRSHVAVLFTGDTVL
jgi:sulfopyruvate decarboxylase subunit alpha